MPCAAPLSNTTTTCKPTKKECSNCPCGGLDPTKSSFVETCQVEYGSINPADPYKAYNVTTDGDCSCLGKTAKLYPVGKGPDDYINGQKFALFCMTEPKNPIIKNDCNKDNCKPPYKDYTPDSHNPNLFEVSGCGWMVWDVKDGAFKIQVSGALAIAGMYAALSL